MPARETERSRSRFLPRKKRQVSVRATGQLDTQHAWCGLEMLRDAAPTEADPRLVLKRTLRPAPT